MTDPTLYTEQDRTDATSELHKRRFRVLAPSVLLLLVAIASFVWFRMHHDVSSWWITACLTLLAGAYFLFFYEVYQRPVSLYKRHVDFMLDARKRETIGILHSVDREPKDKDGLDCISFSVNVGEHEAPEDDRLFYLDALKPLPDWQDGARVRVLSSDRMVSGMEIVPKET